MIIRLMMLYILAYTFLQNIIVIWVIAVDGKLNQPQRKHIFIHVNKRYRSFTE